MPRRHDAIFRAIFESAAVGFSLVDRNGVILRANRAFEEIIGYEPGGLVGVPVAEITHPDFLAQSNRNMDALRAGRAADYREEKQYVRKDGRVIWVRLSVARVPPTDGSTALAVGVIEDITTQREALAAREEQNRDLERLANVLRAVLDSTVDGILLTDRDGNIQLANRPMVSRVQELGIPQDGTATDRLLAIAPKMVDPDAYRAAMERLAAQPEEPSWNEFELAEPARVFQGFTAPVRGDDGEFVGRVWTLREVTRERELDRLKDEFIATVSHELRTPLTSMMGFLEMVRDGTAGPLTPEQDRFLEIVYRSSERLQRLVGDLLFVARLDASGLQLEIDDVRLDEVVAEQVEAFMPLARAREVDLDVEIAAVPPVRGDRERLTQLVANLLSNAVKFTPAPGRVTARTLASERVVVVEVEDTGIGIPEAEQERIFERFFRSSTATAHAIPGTGLGLVITKAIAEAHGGTIAVRSQAEAGTCFRVELPVR